MITNYNFQLVCEVKKAYNLKFPDSANQKFKYRRIHSLCNSGLIILSYKIFVKSLKHHFLGKKN